MAQNMVASAKSAGIGFILALIGLVLTIVLAVVGRLDTIHAILL